MEVREGIAQISFDRWLLQMEVREGNGTLPWPYHTTSTTRTTSADHSTDDDDPTLDFFLPRVWKRAIGHTFADELYVAFHTMKVTGLLYSPVTFMVWKAPHTMKVSDSSGTSEEGR